MEFREVLRFGPAASRICWTSATTALLNVLTV